MIRLERLCDTGQILKNVQEDSIWIEGSQIKIRAVFMLDIVMGYVSVAQALYGNLVRQPCFPANRFVSLVCAAANTATKRKA